MAEKSASRQVTIAGTRYALQRARVERAMRRVLPEPLKDHFVVVNGRRYPPKQVIGAVTGLDRADFTTHQARRILVGLGFPAARRSAGEASARRHRASARPDEPLAERLRPLAGEWVAVRGDEVLVSAATPGEVVSWLARHRQRAESMFRVPEDEAAAGGAAPA